MSWNSEQRVRVVIAFGGFSEADALESYPFFLEEVARRPYFAECIATWDPATGRTVVELVETGGEGNLSLVWLGMSDDLGDLVIGTFPESEEDWDFEVLSLETLS